MADDITNIQDEIKLQLETRIIELKSYIIDNSLFSTVIDDEIEFPKYSK